MVNDGVQDPEREGSLSLWVSAFVLSLILHSAFMAYFRSTRFRTFTEIAIEKSMHEKHETLVTRLPDTEFDPQLFPEFFPEPTPIDLNESLDRLSDEAARPENDVSRYEAEDAGSSFDTALADAPQPEVNDEIKPRDIEAEIPEDQTLLEALPPPETPQVTNFLPAVPPDELVSRLTEALDAQRVTAGSVSDALFEAAQASAGAMGAKDSKQRAEDRQMTIETPDPFELAEKSLEVAPPPVRSFEAEEAAEIAAERRAAEDLAERRNRVSEENPGEDSDGPAIVALNIPKVDSSHIRSEKAAVDRLKDSQEGQPFDEHVTLDLDGWIDPAEPQWKYFRVRINSLERNPLPVVPKDLVVLIDVSGSIGNIRLEACASAVSDIIDSLGDKDRFNLVSFANSWDYAFEGWQENSYGARRKAKKWLKNLESSGTTDVFASLSSTLTLPRDPERPLVALVITDGEATTGMVRSSEILSSFTRLNGGLVSVYMYGIKDKANAYLMDLISRGNRGGWARHERVAERSQSDPYDKQDKRACAKELPALAASFSQPVLSDFTVVFSASSGAEAYPRLVTNLYKGEPLEIWGRCPAEAMGLVFQLKGLNGSTVYDSYFRRSFGSKSGIGPEAKTEWARRKIYALIGEYALEPRKELIDEMRALARDNNLTIPYSSELAK